MIKKLQLILRHLFHPHKSNRHRAHLLHPETLFILFIISAVTIFAVQSLNSATRFGNVLGFASSISVEEVVSKTNERRSDMGLANLTFNSQLAAAARAKGEDMFAHQYWAHTSPTGIQPWSFIMNSGYQYSVAGENLARDFEDTGTMMQAWMDSPTHRANIINSKYTEIGIAVINGQLEGYDTTLVVQMFGAPRLKVAEISQIAPSAELQIVGKAQAQEVKASITPKPSPTPTAPQTNTVIPEITEHSNYVQLADKNQNSGFTPLMIIKAVFVAIALLLMFTLIYDILIIGRQHSLRMVGKNLAHFIFLGVVLYLIIVFKAGLIG